MKHKDERKMRLGGYNCHRDYKYFRNRFVRFWSYEFQEEAPDIEDLSQVLHVRFPTPHVRMGGYEDASEDEDSQ